MLVHEDGIRLSLQHCGSILAGFEALELNLLELNFHRDAAVLGAVKAVYYYFIIIIAKHSHLWQKWFLYCQ